MLDAVLYIVLGLLVLVISVWGGIVSVKSLPAEEKHPGHVWVFVGCGALAFILTLIIGFRNYYAQKESTRLQIQLSSSLQQTSTQLKTATDMLLQSRLSEESL